MNTFKSAAFIEIKNQFAKRWDEKDLDWNPVYRQLLGELRESGMKREKAQAFLYAAVISICAERDVKHPFTKKEIFEITKILK